MKGQRWKWVVAVGAILIAGASGCASRKLVSFPGDSVSLSLKPTDYRVLAPVEGQDCAGVLLWVFRFGSPSLLHAEEAARRAVPQAELVINKHVYWQSEWWLPGIIGRQCLRMEGLAMRLTR